MIGNILKIIDWFVPEASKYEISEHHLARNFVFTHLAGPILSQLISVFLYQSDPTHGLACWIMIFSIWAFLALPFLFKWSGDLRLCALVSVELLAFTSLFGAYFYGGVSSPFLPWFVVSLLLGFFYLSDQPRLVIGLFTVNIALFFIAYAIWGFPQLLLPSQLTTVGWMSILSATVYMSWMAIYYANMISQRSSLERESERHQATTERLRVAKEMADLANRTKSIFVAKMSHELRTPLNAVIGFSEILLENAETEKSPSHKISDLQRINAAGKHLLSLVTDVLDLSKIEKNTIELRIEGFDLNEIISEIEHTVQPLVSKNRNKLKVDCPARLGSIISDRTKLKQVALNLISNSAKFTTDGLIVLRVRREKMQSSDWIELEVRDTGIGMSRSEIDRLFENFGQATPAISGNYGGSGLGLALSQKLCASMGGGIIASSEPGKGSNFKVRIPADLGDVEDLKPDMLLSPAAA